MELEAKCEKYSQIKLDIEKIGRCDVEIITMHDPGGKYSRGLFGETGDFSFTSGMELKWTHIHLFGMSMIFIFVGAITIWLDASSALRSWLVVLPFIGVLVDILAMWLKAFVSLREMWFNAMPAARRR